MANCQAAWNRVRKQRLPLRLARIERGLDAVKERALAIGRDGLRRPLLPVAGSPAAPAIPESTKSGESAAKKSASSVGP